MVYKGSAAFRLLLTLMRQKISLISLAVFISGFASLAFQVIWQRVFTQSIGSDAVSVTVVVASFMIFLGIGSELARKILLRWPNKAAVLYILAELVVGIYGLFSIDLLRLANGLLISHFNTSLWIDVFFNMIFLSVPIIAMGVGLPMIIQITKSSIDNLGKTVGMFYGINIFGAALGAIITGLFLIEILGLRATSQIAALMDVVAGLSVYVLFRSEFSQLKSESSVDSSRETQIFDHPRIWISALCFGYCTLAVQMGLFRILTNYFTMSTVVFPVILSAYLLLMAAGQWIGGFLSDRYSKRIPTVIASVYSLGAFLLLLALHLPPGWTAGLGVMRFTSFNGTLIANPQFDYLTGDPGYKEVIALFAFSLVFMSVVLCWSSLFPLVLRYFSRNISAVGADFARVYYTQSTQLVMFLVH